MAARGAHPFVLPSRPRMSALCAACDSPLPLPGDPETNPVGKTIRSPAVPDRVERTSFSSIKENITGVPQSFTDSKTSSYLRRDFALLGSEDAVDSGDCLSSGCSTPVEKEQSPEMLNPQSALHGLVCPCDSFRGWKSISIGGKVASKSFGDLRRLARGWDWEAKDDRSEKMIVGEDGIKEVRKEDGKIMPGQSPLERLPMELLGAIIDQLVTDIPPNGFTARNIDLMSLLLTSRSLHSATLSTLYAQITIPHSRIFRKFLSHISVYPSLGTIVRRLDFSHFNPTGAGMSRRERMETRNLIPETLKQCLELVPNLREFLAQEHIDDEIDVNVLESLFGELPKLKAVDFCACSSTKFKEAWVELLDSSATKLPAELSVQRLGFHECTILPCQTFTTLLPRLPRLTHLDVAHTRITDAALHSIPKSARLTHLNLSKCTHLTGPSVVSFLATHPAARSLVYLNLGMDAKSHELFSEDDISALLPVLPPTLRSLNLKGSKMLPTHIPLLLPLTKHLEELSLGRNLELSSITRLFVPDPPSSSSSSDPSSDDDDHTPWTNPQLRYLDVSDLSLPQLDLSTLFSTTCPLLRPASAPLEVIEVSGDVSKKLEKSQSVLQRAGWCLKEAGRRWWMVRDPGVRRSVDAGVNARVNAVGAPGLGNGEHELEKLEKLDTGAREWKWGANYWGMRKIPVARAEVGGMYGHYMFKR